MYFFWKMETKPFTYSCRISSCEELPRYIKHAIKHGDTYEYGSFVTYVCDEGFIFKHPKTGKASKTIALECRGDLQWDIDVSILECIRINCMAPYQPKNATLFGVNYGFQSEVTIKCIPGYFFDQISKPGWKEQIIQCDSNEKWDPDPYSFSCAAFDCGDPVVIPNSAKYYEATTLHNAVKYTCNTGYVFDFGSGGLVVNEPAILEMEVKCSFQLAWLPDPSLLKCTKIQCWNPQAPAHGYIAGGEWINNKLHFFYLDEAIASCARGYLSKESSLTMTATCLDNGEWSRNLTNIECYQLSCLDPVDIENSILEWSGSTRYYAKATYTCIPGHFIRPGATSIITQCSHEGYWKPRQSFSCSKTQCENPGTISNADKKDLSGNGNYSLNALVEYRCVGELLIAREQDATGSWVTNEEEEKQSIKIICTKLGKWHPSTDTIHCTESNTGITMKDIVTEDDIAQTNYLGEITSRSYMNISGRMNIIQYDVKSQTVVGEHCLHNQVIIINDIGQWLHPEMKEDVFTRLHPAVIEETGEICDVWNMFDNNPDSFWMPLELPPEIPQQSVWDGWRVDWNLKSIHVIGSIRLHTSDNFVNDVKEFFVEFSLNQEAWTSVGPFNVYNGSEKRSAFFHGFKPIQTQHIRLRVTSTALNQNPIISRFSVYGTTIDCVTDNSVFSTTMIVPLFFIVLTFIFAMVVKKAFDLDVKDRWRRYILFVPGNQIKKALPGKSKVIELSLTTLWKRQSCDVDLLFRVVGETADRKTPIIWLRHSNEKLLRPGFTDTIALYFPIDVGFIDKIDIVAICKQMREFPKAPYPSGNVQQNVAQSDITNVSSQQSITKSWMENINTDMLHILKYKKDKSEDNSDSVIQIGKLVVRDPIGGYKAFWDCETNSCLNTAGRHLKHGILQSFPLQTVETHDTAMFIPRIMKSFLYQLCQLNPFICVISTRNSLQPIVSNYSRVEKAFVVIIVMCHGFLIDAVQHGMIEPILHFGSDPPKTVSEWLTNYFSSSKILNLFISTIIVAILTSLQKQFCGKWHRSVEDPVSFWQSTHPYRAMLHMLLTSVQKLFDKCSQRTRGISAVKRTGAANDTTAGIESYKDSEYNNENSLIILNESPSKEPSHRLLPRSQTKGTRKSGTMQHLDPADVEISLSSGDKVHSPTTRKDPCSKDKAAIVSMKEIKPGYSIKQLYGNFPQPSSGPIAGDFLDHPLKSSRHCIDPISNKHIDVEIDEDVLSLLSSGELRTEIITHRVLPPENPFLEEEAQQSNTAHRFILLLGIILYSIIAIFYVSVHASNCSINTSIDLVMHFLLSMFIDVVIIMPFASCLLAFCVYLYGFYMSVNLGDDKL